MSELKKASNVTSAEVAEKEERFVNETLCITKLLSIADYTNPEKRNEETGEIKRVINLKVLDFSATYESGLFENPVILEAWINDSSADYILKAPKLLMDIPCKIVIQKKVYENKKGKLEKEEKRITALVNPEKYAAYKQAVKDL